MNSHQRRKVRRKWARLATKLQAIIDEKGVAALKEELERAR